MKHSLINFILLLSLVPYFSLALSTDDQCYNVTCAAITAPTCISTSENDKTITLNSVYCSNGQSNITSLIYLDKTKYCKLNSLRNG